MKTSATARSAENQEAAVNRSLDSNNSQQSSPTHSGNTDQNMHVYNSLLHS